MATNFFPSRHRCCGQCLPRKIKVGDKEVTEYYHRGVVCHLVGFELAIPLDAELIRLGENEVCGSEVLKRHTFLWNR
jgi:hypothetical protein